jgi:hypothetical protein
MFQCMLSFVPSRVTLVADTVHFADWSLPRRCPGTRTSSRVNAMIPPFRENEGKLISRLRFELGDAVAHVVL